jgi:hypothetical protein
MTRGWILGLALAAWGAGAAAQDAAQNPPAPPADAPAPIVDPVDITGGVSLADVRTIVGEARGTVDTVKENDDGGFTVETSFPNGDYLWFQAMTCRGTGDERRCPEYEMGMTFKTKSAAEARRLAPKLQFEYLQGVARDDDVTFTRMDFTYGGVTRGHIAESLRVMIEMCDNTIAPVIWPDPAPK